MEIDPRFPTVSKAQSEALLEVRQSLEAQAPSGAPVSGAPVSVAG
jgi:hypothetical protein